MSCCISLSKHHTFKAAVSSSNMVIITDESSHPCKYHVFLSFRGEDTRTNFTGHLYKALRDKGIVTFMDDQLQRGEDISTSLIQAIRDSQISIVVFSENYAFSKWCLEELVNIVERSVSNQQIIVPVFFKVDPSDVRHQRGSFGEGLAKLEGRFNDKVPEWKTVLNKVANLSGFHLLDKGCSEADLIGEIVKDISKKVDDITELDVAEYQVGMEPRVEAVRELLRLEVSDVRMVGIWGPGGIGKTTLAKAVFNSIAHKFDGSCFLEDVREKSVSTAGIVKLQKMLLREILRDRELKVTSSARGITMIKEKLQGKSVLLVLDDVSDIKQLENLACRCSWFGTGSRIIIITRDMKLLRCHGIHTNLTYEVQELDDYEALELFCVKAFKRSQPNVGFAELAERAVRYTHGLPLALTVLGSSLRGGDVELWEAALDGSENHHIKDVLKISYDGLGDRVKEAFLDIACFFKGESREHVSKILEASGSSKYVINVLIEKSLIRIQNSISIWMHDLVEEMGRDIVHQQSPYDPGKRSRLWFYEDVYRVLIDNIGTNNVRGIKVELPEDSAMICLSPTTFSSMKNLKLLIYRAGRYSGVVDNLPNSLRVIDWPDCPLQPFPSNNIPRELSLFYMPRSQITVLGDGFKHLINLTSINLAGCQYLTKVSDISGIPNLQQLNLAGCGNLVELHPSVGFLEKLNFLDLTSCRRLETFLVKVSWKSMRELRVYNCSSLENFIHVVDKMESLEMLNLSRGGIKEVHSWIGSCTSLEDLNLSHTPIRQLPSTFRNLTSLIRLDLNSTPLKELPSWIGCLTSLSSLNASQTLIEELPSSIGNLISLRHLDLHQTLFKQLPSSIGNLTCLDYLNLSQTLFKELPSSIGNLPCLREFDLSETLIKELPSSIGTLASLEMLNASKTLIEELPSLTFGYLTSLTELNLSSTPLRELPSSIGSLTSLRELNASGTLIEELPLSIGTLNDLEILTLRGCANLRNVPYSVYGGLEHLQRLDLSWCPKLVMFPTRESCGASSSSESLPLIDSVSRHTSLLLFPELERLAFEGCNLSEVSDILTNLDCKSTLSGLDLSGSSFDTYPACIGELLNLDYLELRGCKRLRDISELPPNLEEINLNGCTSLERFSKLSDILKQRDTPGILRRMKLYNCNRLMDNVGTDLVSKMAKSLPYQVAQADVDQDLLYWTLVLPSLLATEVPNWFDRGEIDASVGEIDDDMCEILIKLPRNLKAEETTLVICVIFEITENIDNEIEDLVATVMIDEETYENGYYLEAKTTDSSTCDHVLVQLIYISFNELTVLDHIVGVKCYPGYMVKFRSFGVHLAVRGECMTRKRKRDSSAFSSEVEGLAMALASLALDDSFTRGLSDDHHERELYCPLKRSRLQ